LRWFRIGVRGFWYDEAFSSLIARLSLAQILDNAALSVHPPGYYLLLHFWLPLGQSETAIRSLSALFSLGAIPLVYGLGRRLFGPPVAALAALGMALFPFQVYFAQEARMYGVLIFLAAALMWIFFHFVSSKSGWLSWLGYTLVATLSLYVHYFIAFLLLGLHLWLVLDLRRNRAVVLRLLLADGVVLLLFLPQIGQALTLSKMYLGGLAWQSSPSILSPVTTIYYLLFAHRTPVWLVPIGLFLVLAVLLLTLWESRSRKNPELRLERALWLCLLIPIAAVMIISWLIRPIYLERSFAFTTPALALLLARGATSAPRQSPTRYLVALLTVPIVITLAAHVITPDPAKPPTREAIRVVEAGVDPGDVSLHLQDASFMSAVWYAPDVPHLLIDVPDALFIGVPTHRLFGGDVVSWQSALAKSDRLWLIVMPGYNGPEQIAVRQMIDASYPQLVMEDWGAVQLYLYDLSGSE
jgi:uncharacterized membrane protein